MKRAVVVLLLLIANALVSSNRVDPVEMGPRELPPDPTVSVQTPEPDWNRIGFQASVCEPRLFALQSVVDASHAEISLSATSPRQ